MIFFRDISVGKCVVNNENISKAILEIAKQELVQKLHLMIATLQPFVKQLQKYSQF